MGEVRGSQVQVPAPEIRAGVPDRTMVSFGEGLAAGREWARKATQRTLDWIEGHPGQALLIALGAGFVLGGLLFRTRVRVEEEARD
ncbi:MAG TPA: hypothetical protein VEQ15_16160 [Myxococcales bacterium]|nr:hypothetical protein [Myxococcales bacterium]